jgi:hypothetical protein
MPPRSSLLSHVQSLQHHQVMARAYCGGFSSLLNRPCAFGFQRVNVHLHLVHMTAPNAAARPMLKTCASFGDPLNLHARLAYRATGAGCFGVVGTIDF